MFSGVQDVFSHENEAEPFHSHVAEADCEIRGRKDGADQYWKRTNDTESMLPSVSKNNCFEHDVPTPGVLHPFVYEDTAVLDNGGLDPYSVNNLYGYVGINSVRLWMNSDSSHICLDDKYYGNWEREKYYDWPEPFGRMTAREIFAEVPDDPADIDNFYDFMLEQNWDYRGAANPDDFNPSSHYEKNRDRGIRVPYDGTGYPSDFIHFRRYGTTFAYRDTAAPRRYAGNVFCIGDRPAIEGVMASIYMPDCSKYYKGDGRVLINFEYREIPEAERDRELGLWRICVALADHLHGGGYNTYQHWTPSEREHRSISTGYDFHDDWNSLE